MTLHDPALLDSLLQELRENNFQDLRVLTDGTIIGTLNLLFTSALCVDISQDSWHTAIAMKTVAWQPQLALP